MIFFDISVLLENGMAHWPGDAPFVRVEKINHATVSKLTMSSHSGTHIDAPRHFLFNRQTVEKIALAKLVGKAKVARIGDISNLKIAAHDKILLKNQNNKSLTLAQAHFLIKKKIDLVGIDSTSIESEKSQGDPVHKALLRAGIVIVEGLNLHKVKHGVYNLAVLPLRIKGGDGAPARAVLWR